ncbi:MAG TPA: metalloregulator ArsR/SmtB family transcription factor [Caulobacteraceae bacterium]|nr:metalloregulator ArsR/SmtB family transcription factor [Caulobacteraceae bacterium]
MSEAHHLLQALGDATRRALVERLSERPHSVTELAVALGVTPTAVIQHLQVLQSCRLASTEKTGRKRICRLDERGLEILFQWIADHRADWTRKLDRLGQHLEKQDKDG